LNNLIIAYIIFAIVLLHLAAGFAWVIYKFSKKNSGNYKDKDAIESKDE